MIELQQLTEDFEELVSKQNNYDGVLDEYRIRLVAERRSMNGQPLDKKTLYDSHDLYCSFCGKFTYYYDNHLNKALCAKHYKELRKP